MPHYASFHLGLHCKSTGLGGSSIQRVNRLTHVWLGSNNMTSAKSVDPVEMPHHAASSSGSTQFAILKAISSCLDNLEISTLILKDLSKSFYTFIIEGLILIGINWLIQNNFKVGAAVV